MNKNAALLYKCCMEMTHAMTGLTQEVEEYLKEPTGVPVEERVDATFSVKMCGELLASLKTRLNKLQDLQNRIIWASAMAKVTTTGNAAEATLRTPFCTVSVRTDFGISLPSRPKSEEDAQSEVNVAMANWLGVPAEKLKFFGGFHYSTIVERLSEAMRNGEPLPVGLDPNKMFPIPHLTFRGKAPIMEALRQTETHN